MKPLIKSLPLYVKLTCALLSLISLGYLAILGKAILSPLLFASLFAILLQPLAAFIQRKCRLPRPMASITAVLLFILIISMLFYVLGGQGRVLAREWPKFQLQLDTSLTQAQTWISATANIKLDQQLIYFNNASSRFLTSGSSMIGSTLISLSAMLFFVLFTCIYTIFFLQYRSLIKLFFLSIFPEENMALVHEIAEKIQTIIRQYIIGLLIEMGTISTVLCIAFSILGIHYAILLGLLSGLLNLIPYIGIFITLVVSVLITFATASLSKVFLVIIVLVCTHLVDANLLFPWIVGSKVRINPMTMIAGVFIGGMIWGIAGMFLSIPVIAVLKIIFDRIDGLKPWGLLLGPGDHRPHHSAKSVDQVHQPPLPAPQPNHPDA
ncbi:AI-2E family transporter [Flavitalea flava]